MAEKRMPWTRDHGTNCVTTDNYFDELTQKWYHTSEQDVEPILKQAKLEKNEFDVTRNSSMKYGELTKVAMIPNIIIDKLIRDGIWGDQKRMKQWLNSSDNKGWRTNTMRV
jgi:hypothetical protein